MILHPPAESTTCRQLSTKRTDLVLTGHCSVYRVAFTLIELMIAITIFSAVMLAIYSSWTAILRASKVGLTAAAEAQRTRLALRALQEALGSAELFAANIQHYSFIADTSGDFAAMSFVARLPASFPGSGLFGDQAVRRVTFLVEPGPNSQNQLVLRQSPLLEPEDPKVRPYTILLAPNVRVFQMEFLDTNTLEWLPEWIPTNQLPKVVRIAANFGSGQGPVSPDDLSVQTIALTSVAIPRELQIPLVRRGGIVPGGAQGRAPRGGLLPGQVVPGENGRRIRSDRGDGTGGQRDFIYRDNVRPVPIPGGRNQR